MESFIDSSVFVYAYLKPRRKLTEREAKVKSLARDIVGDLEEGRIRVVMTVVHLSEVLNILEDRLGLRISLEFLELILSSENIELVPVGLADYQAGLEIARRFAISANDAIAYIKMRERGIDRIYTFDRHFRNLKDIMIVPNPEEYET